jgi:hypothetical protein
MPILEFKSFWPYILGSELPALLVLAVAIVAQRRARFGRIQFFVYGLSLLQLAIPSSMFVSALLFGHDSPVIAVGPSTSDLLGYLPFCLYLLQFPVGVLVAFFLAYRVEKTNHSVVIVSLCASLLLIQMLFSWSVMFLTGMTITGDFL